MDKNKSKRVCYNLNKSEYCAEYKGYKFYFSSRFNEQRFKARLLDFIEQETFKVTSKYHNIINFDVLVAIRLYCIIEKRGFFVTKPNNTPLPKYYESLLELV